MKSINIDLFPYYSIYDNLRIMNKWTKIIKYLFFIIFISSVCFVQESQQ